MVYFLTMYERQDYQILDQLVNQMEGDVTSPPPDPKTWRGKASQWMQAWRAKDWGQIDQFHQWCLD
jgi:hypothetical protein